MSNISFEKQRLPVNPIEQIERKIRAMSYLETSCLMRSSSPKATNWTIDFVMPSAGLPFPP
jgi:hypothetical protein